MRLETGIAIEEHGQSKVEVVEVSKAQGRHASKSLRTVFGLTFAILPMNCFLFTISSLHLPWTNMPRMLRQFLWAVSEGTEWSTLVIDRLVTGATLSLAFSSMIRVFAIFSALKHSLRSQHEQQNRAGMDLGHGLGKRFFSHQSLYAILVVYTLYMYHGIFHWRTGEGKGGYPRSRIRGWCKWSDFSTASSPRTPSSAVSKLWQCRIHVTDSR